MGTFTTNFCIFKMAPPMGTEWCNLFCKGCPFEYVMGLFCVYPGEHAHWCGRWTVGDLLPHLVQLLLRLQRRPISCLRGFQNAWNFAETFRALKCTYMSNWTWFCELKAKILTKHYFMQSKYWNNLRMWFYIQDKVPQLFLIWLHIIEASERNITANTDIR